jgi:hypothetical protein
LLPFTPYHDDSSEDNKRQDQHPILQMRVDAEGRKFAYEPVVHLALFGPVIKKLFFDRWQVIEIRSRKGQVLKTKAADGKLLIRHPCRQ